MNVKKYSEKELLEAKQVFMFSVLDQHLLTDVGKPLLGNMRIQLMHNLCEGFSRIYEVLIQGGF